jgi:hypothetical protein
MCPHKDCGGDLILAPHDEVYGKTPTLYVMKCFQCGRMAPSRKAYYSRRHYHRNLGISYDDLESVRRGRESFVWEVPA